MATRDSATIADWFKGHPDRNVGVVTGRESDLIVLDIDVKNGARGREALAALELRCGHLPTTLREETPSGGEHIFFRLDGADIPNGRLDVHSIPGIDVCGRAHNLVVAPSTIDGRPYRQLQQWCDIAKLPLALTDLLRCSLKTSAKARLRTLGGGKLQRPLYLPVRLRG
jgi:putative DNA primase/helicase